MQAVEYSVYPEARKAMTLSYCQQPPIHRRLRSSYRHRSRHHRRVDSALQSRELRIEGRKERDHLPGIEWSQVFGSPLPAKPLPQKTNTLEY